MPYKINELAKLAGISVRTLHFYDAIGLLKPKGISKNGYRYYDKDEVLKLQQILFFRELGFALIEIKQALNQSDFVVVTALREHKKLIILKRKRLGKLIQTIDKTIKHMSDNKTIKDEELYDPFKDDDVKKYQAEAKLRWGNTNAYKQSMAKVRKMTKAEMDKLKADGEKLTKKFAANMDMGATHPDVQALVAEHYKSIQFFYDCPLPMYKNLGQMYVIDRRFAANYDRFRPGLSVFLRDAIKIYCDRQARTK